MFLCIFFFAGWPAAKRSALKVFLEQYEPPSNESDAVDNNGDNEALPKGSDTRDTRTENNDSSAPKKEARCSPLDQLVHAATAKTVQKVEEDAVAATDIVSDTSSNNVSQAKHSRKNPNKPDETKDRLSDQSNAAGNDSNQDNHGVHTNTKTNALAKAPALSKNTCSTSDINLFGTLSDSESSSEKDDISKAVNETVSKVTSNAVTATEIASDTSSNNVSQAKHSSKNPNKLDNTKDRLSDQSNAAGNDSNQDNHGVHTNTNTDALAKASALSKNAGNTSGTDFGSSDSESAAEEENVSIPYQLADKKWDYIMCDINNIKKHAENASIQVALRIQTCFIRSGQYQGDFVQLHSEFVLVWHFLCYLFNFLCCSF